MENIVQVGKKSFGALARLRGAANPIHREFSSGEYVCPIETKNSEKSTSMASHRSALETKIQLQEMKNKRIIEEEDDSLNAERISESGSIEIVEVIMFTIRQL